MLTAKTPRYDGSSLTNRDICHKYSVTVRNKIDTLQELSETHTPNDEYEKFVNAAIDAAAEYLQTKQIAKCIAP